MLKNVIFDTSYVKAWNTFSVNFKNKLNFCHILEYNVAYSRSFFIQIKKFHVIRFNFIDDI